VIVLPSSSHRANSSFKATDAGSYDEVALVFDGLSELYSAQFADELISVADVGEGQLVPDLGAGAGIGSRRVLSKGARCVARARKQLPKVPARQLELLREEFLEQANRVLERGGLLAYDVAATWIRAERPSS